MDSRRSPQRVGDAYLADQPANFQRYSWSTAAVPRFPAPIQSETGTMPTDHGVRLHNRQRLDGIRRQTIQPNKDQAIHGIEGQSLRKVPPLDVKLMTKDQDLSFQRDPRPEQQDQHRPDQAVSFSHEAEALRDSASRTSRIGFPTGTPDSLALVWLDPRITPCCKSRKSRRSENLANVAHWRFQPLQGSVESIRGSAIAFAVIDVGPSPRSERDAPAVLRIFSHQRKRTFSTQSAKRRPHQNGRSQRRWTLPTPALRARRDCRQREERFNWIGCAGKSASFLE